MNIGKLVIGIVWAQSIFVSAALGFYLQFAHNVSASVQQARTGIAPRDGFVEEAKWCFYIAGVLLALALIVWISSSDRDGEPRADTSATRHTSS